MDKTLHVPGHLLAFLYIVIASEKVCLDALHASVIALLLKEEAKEILLQLVVAYSFFA